MIEPKLVELLNQYIKAFKSYDLSSVRQCYHLPCALHTPDKIVYLVNEEEFDQEFIQIFTVLQQANISDIKILKATFNEFEDSAVDMCIDWVFIDENGDVFTDFCAFYHLVLDKKQKAEKQNIAQPKVEQQYKIMSVVSHELSNSVELSFNLSPKLLS